MLRNVLQCSSRLKLGQRILKNNVPIGARGLRAFADGGTHATHNDLPIPCGDWYEDYNKRNAKYNRFLGSGIVASIISIIVFFNSEYVFLNATVPELID